MVEVLVNNLDYVTNEIATYKKVREMVMMELTNCCKLAKYLNNELIENSFLNQISNIGASNCIDTVKLIDLIKKFKNYLLEEHTKTLEEIQNQVITSFQTEHKSICSDKAKKLLHQITENITDIDKKIKKFKISLENELGACSKSKEKANISTQKAENNFTEFKSALEDISECLNSWKLSLESNTLGLIKDNKTDKTENKIKKDFFDKVDICKNDVKELNKAIDNYNQNIKLSSSNSDNTLKEKEAVINKRRRINEDLIDSNRDLDQ